MRSRVLSALIALCTAAGPAVAQDWQAIVIGQPGPDAVKAFRDSFDAGSAFKGAGLTPVQEFRDTAVNNARSAFLNVGDRAQVVLYMAGPFLPGGKGLVLKGGPLTFEQALKDLAAGGAERVALLIEDCAGAPKVSSPLTPPEAPPGVELWVVATAGPGAICDAETRMTDRLVSMDGTGALQDALEGSFQSGGVALIPLGRAEPSQTPGSTPLISEAGESDSPIVSVVSAAPAAVEIVSVAPSAAPVSAVPATPAVARSDGSGGVAGQTITFAALPDSQLAARPTRAGLPEPSIIIGLLEVEDDRVFEDVSDQGDVLTNEISYDNLAARNGLRQADPALFASLVEGGAFDPPADILPTALQTELKRMGCYTARIDGDWGRGSKASVTRYFEQVEGAEAVTLDPTIDLFRQIITREDVACTVAAAAPARQSSGSTRSSSSTTTRRAAPAAPKPQSSGRSLRRGSLGSFR